jgi:signal transduction histidine kinase
MSESLTSRFKLNANYLHEKPRRNANSIENLELIQQIIDSNAHFSALLNSERRIVLSNQHLLKMSGLENLESAIGERPGEIISCINVENNNGCGNSLSCRYCGIVSAIIESNRTGKKITGEARITARVKGKLINYDFRVTSSPLTFSGEQYTLVNIMDISSEKKNALLENIFFHDVLNRMGGFSGIVQMLKMENKQPELEEYIHLIDTIGEMVIEDIQTQRYIKSAENENLILNIHEYSAYSIIESVRKQIAFLPTLKIKQIEVQTECSDFTVKTDLALLKRILLNMVKNAVEATSENGTVRITCSRKNGLVQFSVNNPGEIDKDTQMQIFQRSFSTKGHGRGLGTYSMKIFGENYLKGKVYFRSSEKLGTTFTIELPLTSEQ